MALQTTHSFALGYIGYNIQSVEGTAVAPVYFSRWQSAGPLEDMMKMGTYRGGYTRDLEVAVKEAQYHNGKFTTWWYPDTGPRLLDYFLGGSDVVSGGGPYTHTFAQASTGTPLPFITFENSMGYQQEVDRVRDCRVDQLVLTAKAGGLVTLEVDYMGSVVAAQSSPASVTYETTRPATYVDGSLTFVGLDVASVDVTEVKITMKNGSAQIYTIGQVYPAAIQPQAREYQVDFTVFVPNNQLYREVFFGSSGATTGSPATTYLTSLNVTFNTTDGGPTKSCSITINNVEMEAAKPNYDANASAFMIQCTGKAVATNFGSSLCNVVAINSTSGAYIAP